MSTPLAWSTTAREVDAFRSCPTVVLDPVAVHRARQVLTDGDPDDFPGPACFQAGAIPEPVLITIELGDDLGGRDGGVRVAVAKQRDGHLVDVRHRAGHLMTDLTQQKLEVFLAHEDVPQRVEGNGHLVQWQCRAHRLLSVHGAPPVHSCPHPGRGAHSSAASMFRSGFRLVSGAHVAENPGVITLSSLQAEEQRRIVAACFARTGLTLEQLWLRYFALGGDVSELELEAFMQGLIPLPRIQRDMVAHAINERLEEVSGARRAPYSLETAEDTRPRGPLAALVGLLAGARQATPEQLPEIIAVAGRALDLEVTVYLADHDQRGLLPISGAETRDRVPLPIEASTAGRVYRQAGTMLAEGSGIPRLWTVLLDGDERIGVLEVEAGPGADLHDPALRTQCQWLASLSGHLIAAAMRYGDGLDTRRRQRRRGPIAELISQSLPPLTAATRDIEVAGGIEPAHDVRGATFDYALSETTAWLAVFDAGRDVTAAGLAVSTALAAYRSARREGQGLREQETAVDKALATQFGNDTKVRGTLAEVNLADGGLRYLEAGGKPPLLLGSGHEQSTLDGAGRPPFGGGPPGRIATTRLRPGDLLVLHTEGLSNARVADGEQFAFAGCLDANTGHIPPETVRRVLQAAKSHCHNTFTGDACLLIARRQGR
ncbi:PP2C family protein-serine/threonine phosphatase [Amycolatopsis speibonae]|uniref:PP2C family protein-serine/threonine phosphatase n=1 Tax=Amycolatopsis speibonae TaxID=1450224 RepID=A0ABV7P1K1_9PSEU